MVGDVYETKQNKTKNKKQNQKFDGMMVGDGEGGRICQIRITDQRAFRGVGGGLGERGWKGAPGMM